MDLKSLALGLFFSLGVFAVKSGTGLYHLASSQGTRPRRWLALAAALAVYGLVFWAAYFLAGHIAPAAWLETGRAILGTGMMVHLLLAVLTTLWGVALLGRRSRHRGGRPWVVLLIPCPVLVTTTLLTVSFLVAWFPEQGDRAVRLLFEAFGGVMLATVLALSLISRRVSVTPEVLLGRIMVFIGLYFLLAFVLVPQFGKLDEVYRLAGYQSQDAADGEAVWLLPAFFVLFTAGLVRYRRKPRAPVPGSVRRGTAPAPKVEVGR